MKTLELIAQKREVGRKATRDLRKNDLIPACYYAKGKENVNFVVKAKDIRPFVYTAHKPIAQITIEGTDEKYVAVIKSVSFDPVTDKILHVDFLGLIPNHTLTVDIPIILNGTPIGVRKGGKVSQVIHKVKITTTPELLIDALEIDITDLDIGKQLQFKDITKEGWLFSVPPSALICSVKQTRA